MNENLLYLIIILLIGGITLCIIEYPSIKRKKIKKSIKPGIILVNKNYDNPFETEDLIKIVDIKTNSNKKVYVQYIRPIKGVFTTDSYKFNTDLDSLLEEYYIKYF